LQISLLHTIFMSMNIPFLLKIKHITLFAVVLAWLAFLSAPDGLGRSKAPSLGVWITVFTPEKVLYSTKNIDLLIEKCKKSGINDIYIQLYRMDKAYYDSKIADRSPFDSLMRSAGRDPIKYLINAAHKNNIKVYAWINLLSLAQNEKAGIINKFGDGVLTLDQYGRTPLIGGKKDQLDKYYIREDQLFLEPGDKRVRNYLVSIASEIARNYPGFDGLQLDYIRYPSIVPFAPGSRFYTHSIGYGYSPVNLRNFKAATGLDPKNMTPSRENYKKWDDWRRDQVTSLVKEISETVKGTNPDWQISVTVVPSIERTYTVTLQDWTKWLDKELIDYVVLMNYTDDNYLMELYSRSVMFPRFRNKVHVGMGAFLLKDSTDDIEAQLSTLRDLSPAGIVIFSYDDIANNEELQGFLAKEF